MEWVVEANDTEEMADGKFAVISELVRCKECKYWDRDDEYCVDFLTQDKNGFCSWGERRGDEN